MDPSGGTVEAEWRHFTDVVEAVEALSEKFQPKKQNGGNRGGLHMEPSMIRNRGGLHMDSPMIGIELLDGHNGVEPPLPPLPPQNAVVVESFSGGAPSGLRCMVGMPCAAPRCPERASWWLADPRFDVTGGAWVCLHHYQNGVG